VRYYFFLQAFINILRIMEAALGVIWDFAKGLFSCINEQAASVYKLQENLESLNKKWGDLQNKEKDVQTEIDRAESTGVMKRTNAVNDWLQEFQKLLEVCFKFLNILSLFAFSFYISSL